MVFPVQDLFGFLICVVVSCSKMCVLNFLSTLYFPQVDSFTSVNITPPEIACAMLL